MSGWRLRSWKPSGLLRISLLLHIAALLGVCIAPQYWPQALALVVLNHCLLAAVGLWPRSDLLGSNWTRLPAAATQRGEIAITIDDGPDPEVTPQVLAILEQHGVVATFFCIGAHAQLHAELCRDIARRGHAIENHSLHHRHTFALRGLGALHRDIEGAQAALTALTGARPQFFRAPAGLRNPLLDPVLQRCDLQLAAWTRRGFDTRPVAAATVLRRLSRNLRAGDILLLHDGHAGRQPDGTPTIVAVLPALLAKIRAAGLTPVTLRAARRTHQPAPV
jgi:peptidoglycan/xylan/chitin deacetylase (PgdA/CDA1 family)